MTFNQHGGRSGVRSAMATASKLQKKVGGGSMQSVLAGGGGGQSVLYPNAVAKGLQHSDRVRGAAKGVMPVTSLKNDFSHFHQIHERYNEK
jgi:hypothetical protein